MKHTILKVLTPKEQILRGLVMALALLFGVVGLTAQNSLPAPGSGGGFQPGGGGWGGGAGWGGGWGGPAFAPGPPPSAWGSPWYDGPYYSPTVVVTPQVTNNFQNQGTEKVIACGYDAQGVWRVVPLLVSYQYNGSQYTVNVLNAWNPWTDSWDKGVDEPAYSTDYWLRNVEYSFYTVLPTGTFYFNL